MSATSRGAREYERTHPWIDFKIDLGRLDFPTWLLLGEAESKCEHIAGAPLRPEIAREMHLIYRRQGYPWHDQHRGEHAN